MSQQYRAIYIAERINLKWVRKLQQQHCIEKEERRKIKNIIDDVILFCCKSWVKTRLSLEICQDLKKSRTYLNF